jgi:hypothetical protein
MSLRIILQRGLQHISQRLLAQLDSKKRLWIVQVDEGGLKNQSFIVDEDNFQQPMEWMLNKHYSATDLDNVNNMKCSEVCTVTLSAATHSLIRAK